MKKIPRRLVINLVALIVLIGIVYLGYTRYEAIPGATNDELTRETLADFPDLQTLTVVDTLVEETTRGTEVGLALEIPLETTGDLVLADLLEVYRWSAGNSRPLKCGEEYEPLMCRVDNTFMVLVTVQEHTTPTGDGPAHLYQIFYVFGLDQTYIDLILESPPESLNDFRLFHVDVAEASNNTAGVATPGEGRIYTGLN